MADHQIAHIYVKNAGDTPVVKEILQEVEGVESVLDREAMLAAGVSNERSGDLLAVAEADSWFSYYYWQDNNKAPDFAPTVDIHRKPGYDPAELFVDPELRFPKLRVARRLAQKKLGFRMLMDVIPLNGDQVKGSHGRLTDKNDEKPVLLSSIADACERIHSHTDVYDFLLDHFGGPV